MKAKEIITTGPPPKMARAREHRRSNLWAKEDKVHTAYMSVSVARGSGSKLEIYANVPSPPFFNNKGVLYQPPIFFQNIRTPSSAF